MVLGGFVSLFSARASTASPDSIVGTWQLRSLVREVIATGQRQDTLGEKPDGYVSYSSDGRTMVAYVGSYRIDGDKVIHHIDISWNRHWTGTEQVRVFKIKGDTRPAPAGSARRGGRSSRRHGRWLRLAVGGTLVDKVNHESDSSRSPNHCDRHDERRVYEHRRRSSARLDNYDLDGGLGAALHG